MRKILCILAILTLFVPAVSLAQSAGAASVVPPVVTPVPGTIPDKDLALIEAALHDLAPALSSHNATEINKLIGIAQQKLAAATAGRDDIEASLKAHVKDNKTSAKLKIEAEYPGDKELKIRATVKPNKGGLYDIKIVIKGDLTELQKASLQALVEKAKLNMPGVNITLKISDAKKGHHHHCEKGGDD